MAKKKKRKEEKKQSSDMQIVLVGLLLVLLSIIGFGGYGVVGRLIKAFSIFLCGTWYAIFLTGMLLVGGYMMWTRKKVKFYTSKLIGLYIIIISILMFSHTNYIKDTELTDMEILNETINNFLAATKVVADAQGGGIIGACFSLMFLKLVDLNGTLIINVALFVCGIIMFTGLSIMDFLKKTSSKAKNGLKKVHEEIKQDSKNKKEQSKEKNNSNVDGNNDNKIVVSSVDELIHINDDKDKEIEETKVEEVKEKAITSNDRGVLNPSALVDALDNIGYIYPPITLLAKGQKNSNKENTESIKINIPILEQVFHDFNIDAHVVAANVGPSVTQYEMEVKAGTKVSKILSINREIALALGAKDVRIQAPIPGKKTIGVEIPNKTISMVTVREIMEKIPKEKENSKLLVTLGKSIMGSPVFCEINKTPHLLVAGSTGSGKSVCINSIIISILMRTKPDEVKLVLVDPKKVELSMYNGVPHLLAPVVTDPKKANIALKKIVVEMENRYDIFSNNGVKNIEGYNKMIDHKNESLPDGEKLKRMPFIVVIIDELADLMLVAAKEVEDSIMRITQMARAAGIHLIVATQRPSTDVITGVVKANIPSRISFAVSSQIDSRTILDMGGAEKLLGKGDMLFLPMGENTPQRVQGTFISEEEINAVVNHTISQQKARYDETLTMDEEEMNATTMVDSGGSDDYDEPLYNDIVEFVVTQGKASASLLQRRFRLGYNRAARAIDILEERGIVGPNNGSKPREVLVKVENKENND